MENKLSSNLALFLTALIWGLSFVAQKAGMDYLEPFTFNMIRSFLGGLSLIPVIIFVKISHPNNCPPEIKHKQHINLIRAGIACGIALFLALSVQQYCMQYVDAGKSGFITALYIIFVPFLTVLSGENLSKKIILSIFLAIAGLYLLCYKPQLGFSPYDLLLILGAFLYAVHIMVVNYYTCALHPVKVSCIQFFVVGILSGLLVLLFDHPNVSNILACKYPLLFAGVVTCGIAYTLQIFGQKYTLPVIASLILCLESVFAVLGGAFILGEVLNVKEILGCILMISGVIIANCKIEAN